MVGSTVIWFPIYRTVYLFVSPAVSLPDRLGVNTSECWSAFLAVHLHSHLAACQPDQLAWQSLHLMACLVGRLAACFHVSLPPHPSVCVLVNAMACIDGVPLCAHEDVPRSQLSYIINAGKQRQIQLYLKIPNYFYCTHKNTFCELRSVPWLGWMKICSTRISIFNQWIVHSSLI